MFTIQQQSIPQVEWVGQIEEKLLYKIKAMGSLLGADWLYKFEREYFLSYLSFSGDPVGLFFIIKDIKINDYVAGYKFIMFTGILKAEDLIDKEPLNINNSTLFCTRKILIPSVEMMGKFIYEDNFL